MTRIRHFGALSALMAALAAMLAPIGALTADAAASGPDGVSFTLEGCKNDGSIVLPINGDFVCPDAAYTTGNLGKGWNELDLVPFRLTSDAGNSAPASQTFTIAAVVDRLDAGAPGYDVLAAPTLNTTLSDASCGAATATSATELVPGIGGIDKSLYRKLTFTQAKSTVCVYDYYARLALGSHLFPGASLHANLANEDLGTAGIGARDVSIPVKEILPQELRKDMSAVQDTDHVWNVYKDATPATLNFSDTCSAATGSRSAGVSVTVRWERLAASPSGDVTVLTHVYAKNPASRVITVNVSDDIRSGTTVLDTATAGPVDVAANTEQLVLTHQSVLPAGSSDLNDVATATYTDKVTGVAVPGTTTATATATVQSSGNEKNKTATITDVESITGSNLSFSVDSTSGASGSFSGGYVLGTDTTGPVTWTSGSQNGNGSVTFNKTVSVKEPSITSGTLSDTATLTAADGFTTDAKAKTDITASASVDLTIHKTINVVLGASDGTQTFTFDVTGPNGYSSQKTVSFGTGEGGASKPKDIVISGLVPGKYTVTEQDNSPWQHQDPQDVTIALPKCADSLTFNNAFGPATAEVKKVTVPAGDEAGWDFDLKQGTTVLETVSTTGAGAVSFATALDEGSYSIVEHTKSNYDFTSKSAECDFTVNYPADADRVFSCTYTNTKHGSITVKKVTDPTTATEKFLFSGDVSGSLGNNETASQEVSAGTYTSTETVPSGWDLTKIECTDSDSSGVVGTGVATFKVGPGESVTCTFTNTQRGKAKVVKTVNGAAPSGSQAFVFQLRKDASTTQAGTQLEAKTANAANGGVIEFATLLKPGVTYQLCETVMPGWQTDLGPNSFVLFSGSGDNSVICIDFTVAAGQTKTFNVDNTPPPGGNARTIGFWRNWASCATSSGKQKWVLDKTLYLSNPDGISIGLLTLHGGSTLSSASPDCTKAVRILKKQRIDTAQNMAKDPAYNMAAQLLAAKLNVVAGAETCPAVTQAIADGSALLTAIGFTGTGAYAATMTKAQKLQANNLATTLDKYNNNLLCT